MVMMYMQLDANEQWLRAGNSNYKSQRYDHNQQNQAGLS